MITGQRVYHNLYGEGETVTSPDKNGIITVAFDNAHEVLVEEIIDTDNYFEDNRRLEITNFIDVHQAELKILRNTKYLNYETKNRNPNCHSCGKILSSLTHEKCDKCNGWLKCECGACGCNYVPKS